MGLFSNSVLAVKNKRSKDANRSGGTPFISVFVIVLATLVAYKGFCFQNFPLRPFAKFLWNGWTLDFFKFLFGANMNRLHFVKSGQFCYHSFSEDPSVNHRKDSIKNNIYEFVIISRNIFLRPNRIGSSNKQ